MNNKLSDIRIRRSSIYDAYQEEQDKMRLNLIDEIEVMHEAWMRDPKLRSDAAKR
jgi:hypothetical protein